MSFSMKIFDNHLKQKEKKFTVNRKVQISKAAVWLSFTIYIHN